MTGLLLDTNILIPLLEERSETLPATLRQALEAFGPDCTVSSASLWEMSIKMRAGKLKLCSALPAIPGLIDGLGLRRLSVSFQHAIAEIAPQPSTRDPFDRLLLAQCAVEGMRLVTLDRALAEHPYAWR